MKLRGAPQSSIKKQSAAHNTQDSKNKKRQTINSQSSRRSTVSDRESSSLQQSKIYEDGEESKLHSEKTQKLDDQLREERKTQHSNQSENFSTDSEEEEDDQDILIKPKDLIVSASPSFQIKFFFAQFQSKNNERKWLRNRGKGHMIDFQDDELQKLHQCFVSLVDNENSDSIGVDELEDPLIALGLVDNRQQVQQIVQLVDEDGSKMIEFNEFLDIIKGGSRMNNRQSGLGVQGTSAIFDFFKKLTTGKLQNPQEQELPFSLFISSKRRQKLLDSMMATDPKRRQDGEHILNNYRKQLAERMAREKVDRGDIFERHQSNRGANSSKGEPDDKQDFMTRRMANFEIEVPDSNVLLAILARKGKFDDDLKSELRR